MRQTNITCTCVRSQRFRTRKPVLCRGHNPYSWPTVAFYFIFSKRKPWSTTYLICSFLYFNSIFIWAVKIFLQWLPLNFQRFSFVVPSVYVIYEWPALIWGWATACRFHVQGFTWQILSIVMFDLLLWILHSSYLDAGNKSWPWWCKLILE